MKILHAERKILKTSEERYRAFFDNSYDGILVATREGRIVDANNQASMLFGYPMGELLNLKLGDILSSEAAKKISQQEEAGYYHGIRKVNLKNKTVNWIDVTARLFSLDGSKLNVIHARDITEKTKAEEEKENLRAQLLQAQKLQAIGTLAGGIAHDFNNIVQVILGFSELSMGDLPEGSLARANLEEVIKAGNRAKDLVKQILTFSRQSEHEREPVQIHLIVKETLKLLRATLPATIEIRQNIDTHCGAVLADPTQMHQVMMNLCTNADHAMRERGGVLGVNLDVVYVDADFPGRVRVNLHEGTYLRLTVSDTGHGMARATLERIFEPFFTTKAVDEGSGMGLATVHGIVTSHKGAITVYSEPGKGTTFHVYLPQLERSATQEDGLTPEPTPRGNERILFVDDEEPLARMGQQILEQLGYDVTARTSSVEAIEAFRTQTKKFDLVITDQTMPHMTGAELAQKLMDIRADIPIILCTGFSHIITQEKARALGICDFVMKPVVRAKLGQTVRLVLDESVSSTKQPVL